MQLTPRYGDDAVLRSDSLVDDPSGPVLRQRARLTQRLVALDDDQWAAPTRCEGWSVQDVIAHLVTTNQFWAFSITCGIGGTPTELLATFDPVASPAEMVAAVRSQSPAETLAQWNQSNDGFTAALAAVDGDSWSVLAEAPPGHIAIRLVALHALWDAWVHERDIAIPLGLDLVTEPDEVAASLVYAAGLGPAFLAATGSTRCGALEVLATDPEVRVVVEHGPSVLLHAGPAPAGTVTITGDAVELLEALSLRVPFPAALAAEDRWLLGSLDAVFDQV